MRFHSSVWQPGFPPHSLLAVAICALSIYGSIHVTAQQAAKNVLVLSGGRGRTSINQMQSSLRAHFRGPVNFSILDLENPRFNDSAYLQQLAESIQVAYSGEKIDLLVAVMTQPLQFAAQYRDKIFPGVPIVFMSVSTPLPEKMWPGVTGVLSTEGISETINLALRLQPDTKTVAVIGPGDDTEKVWLQEEHSELLRHRDAVEEVDLIGPASPELLQKVAALPAHTVVLFQLYPTDSDQPAFGAMDVLADVARRFPTYSILPHVILGHGGIGGASYDPTADAVLAGQLAARVLSGERPDNIGIVRNSTAHVQVDWRELQRWDIPESALPTGSVVLFREPGLWERGRKYFLLGLSIIFVQAVLILGLLWQRAQRRRTEAELRRSEERFSKSFRHGPLAISIVRTSDGRYVDVNETFEERTGWRRDEVIGRTPLEIGLWSDPNQRSEFLKQVLIDGGIRNLEVRFRRRDGQFRTSLGSSELIEVGGESCILSVIADITERKAAEEALASLSGRLIEAQEAERTRIARELHDDINQRLAMVALTLKALKQHVSASEVKVSGFIEEACTRISDLEDDVQALSHRLHSSKLEYLGLEAAAEGFCREISERQDVEIGFLCEGVPEALSDQVSLCLFRVLQEAVHNAVKYSGVGKFEVFLKKESSEIQLRVHDSGVGFDTTANNGHGLGLTSMKERLKLVNGELFIDSKLQHGTTILARVPLDTESTNSGGAA
jgi:PAS domain S-box-containing protein